MIGSRFAEAVRLATHAHGDQVRKATEIPYISHPLAVAALAMSFGADEDQAIIAVCHDIVEDCGGEWVTSLRDTFGERVLTGVLGCSDSVKSDKPKLAWRDRKIAYLAHLSYAPLDVALVSLCDKLHNAGCIVADLEVIGTAVFGRFVAGQTGTLWYYNALLTVFSSRKDLPRVAVEQFRAMVHRMNALTAPDIRYTPLR